MTAISPTNISARDIQKNFMSSLETSGRFSEPYRYWVMRDVMPAATAEDMFNLPVPSPADLVFDGRRESNNPVRTYFNGEARARYPLARAFTEAFQAPETVAAIEKECGTDLSNTNLRIEYCQDMDGFWLEPHTDIGVKRFTMSLYLCRGEAQESLGTDIYNRDRSLFGTAPAKFNGAMIFIPSKITFHGFRPRHIEGVRKSLIINYVGPEWRAREELCYPDTPVA